MNPGGRGLRRAPGDEMASCKGRLEDCCKAPLYSADGGRAIALATAAGGTGSVPALTAAVFGDTRVSARVVQNQKTARWPTRASP